ncbi:MAG: CDP-alcohol phosphatidyltransferase family protein [Adlercreutzia sp.]
MSDRIFTVPNIISFVRLCLVPVFLVLLLNGFNVAATLLQYAGSGHRLDRRADRPPDECRVPSGPAARSAVDRILMISGVCGLFLVGRLPLWIILVVLVRDLLLLVGGAVLLKRFACAWPSSFRARWPRRSCSSASPACC